MRLIEPDPMKDKCPSYPDYPANADLDANSRLMMEKSAKAYSPFNTVGTGAISSFIGSFVARVKPGGPWDYKSQSTPEHNYEAFGNFHYGAVAAAAGFNDGQILKAAGFVQKWFGDTEGDGGTVNIINALTGKGGEEPYQDQIRDQANIKLGIYYYIHKFVLKDCE